MRQLNGHQFLRQRVINGAIADFACRKAKLAIELDGGQHDLNKEADQSRTQRLNRAGYRVLRFWNNQVTNSTDAVLETIRESLNEQWIPYAR